MPGRQRENESVVLSGESLGNLIFDWKGDRYHHRWDFADSNCEIASIESDSSEVWPVSPPVQQIHRQSFGDGRDVVFGVGMSGRGHWSASFTLVPDLNSWIVEVACRAPVEPEQLLSSYALRGNWQGDSGNLISCQQPASAISLEAIPPGCAAQVEEADGRESPASAQQLVCFRPLTIAEPTATTQWAFRIRVQPKA